MSDLGTLISLIFIEGLSLSYILIDRFFIGSVPEGGIAALNYALVIFAMPVTLFSIPLITTMFSRFSHLHLKSPEILKRDFVTASRINIFIITPIFFSLFFFGSYFIDLFYKRGAFTSAGSILTYSSLQYYSISLVFYSTYLIIVKLLYSINKYSLVLIISIAAFSLKIFLNISLVDNMQQNGLALSTSLIYFFLFLTGFYLASKNTGLDRKGSYLCNFLYFALNGLISLLIAFIAVRVIVAPEFVSGILSLIIFISVYILNSYLMNDDELKVIGKTILNFTKQH
jgi:putative peptidoglycan lipid II flippase